MNGFNMEVDPTEDTEWNDILRAQGIIPEREPSPSEQIEEALQDAIAKQHENRLENKDLDELDALEDEEDEDFLNFYKQKRMKELNGLAAKAKYGSVYPVSKPEYQKEITECSNECFVFVHLTVSANTQCRLLSSLLHDLAQKYKEIKFVEIQGSRAIENYPDQNCPTILIYHNTNVVKQFITLTLLGGMSTRLSDLEDVLVSINAVAPNDRRLVKNRKHGSDSENETDEGDFDDDERKLRFKSKSLKQSKRTYDSDSDSDFN